ncbi:MAG: hypothetical protein ABFS46_06195 [Myxococcota bacterium]
MTIGQGWTTVADMRCFACAAVRELASGERVGFREACEACGADLHACRNCAHHEPSAYNECRESSAEWVSDRETGNRCDYFVPGSGVGRAGDERDRAKDALDGLFKRR